MPKMRMKASEEEKIRQLRQDIKDMQIDMKETFSVMETMEKTKKPKKKRRSKKIMWLFIAAAAVIVLAAAAYTLFTVL